MISNCCESSSTILLVGYLKSLNVGFAFLRGGKKCASILYKTLLKHQNFPIFCSELLQYSVLVFFGDLAKVIRFFFKHLKLP